MGSASLCCTPASPGCSVSSLWKMSPVPRPASTRLSLRSSAPVTDPGPQFLWLSPWGTCKNPSRSDHSVPWFREKHGTQSEPTTHKVIVPGASKSTPCPLVLESGSLCWPGTAGSHLVKLKSGTSEGRTWSFLYSESSDAACPKARFDSVPGLLFYKSFILFYPLELVWIGFSNICNHNRPVQLFE